MLGGEATVTNSIPYSWSLHTNRGCRHKQANRKSLIKWLSASRPLRPREGSRMPLFWMWVGDGEAADSPDEPERTGGYTLWDSLAAEVHDLMR